ncbi:MAG: RNA polymerase sigma factor [Flavobacteriales bacterium]
MRIPAKTTKDELRKLSDAALLERMGATQDRSSFGIIYERYRRQVFDRTRHMVGDTDDAEDLTQEVFLKLFRNAAKYKQQSAFAAWFKVLTYNTVIDELRKLKKIQLVPLPSDTEAPLPELSESENAIREKQLFELLHDRLMQLLERIPSEEKVILLMKYRDDIPVKSIAIATGLGESAVKMRLRRARKKVLDLDRSMPALAQDRP